MTAIAIYAIGVVSLALCDILATRYWDPSSVALWAETRSLVGLLGASCTLGIELVAMRTPASSWRIVKLSALQVPIIALLASILVHRIGYLSGYITAFGIASCSAFSLVIGQVLRAHGRLTESQLAQQLWKIVSVATFVSLTSLDRSLVLPADSVLALVLAGCLAITLPVTLSILRRSPRGKAREYSTRSIYSFGLRFSLTHVFLALSVYGEQLIINSICSDTMAADFFAHVTFFALPSIALNGYLGFRIAPWISENRERFIRITKAYWLLFIPGVIAYLVVMQAVGYAAWIYLGPRGSNPNIFLQLILFFGALLRTVYIAPSAYNGLFLIARHYDVFIFSSIFGVSLLALSFPLSQNSAFAVYIISAMGVANWFVRTSVGTLLMFRSFKLSPKS